MTQAKMDNHRCIATLSNLLQRNSDTMDTMHEVLDRNTVQSIAFAIAYMYKVSEPEQTEPTEPVRIPPPTTKPKR